MRRPGPRSLAPFVVLTAPLAAQTRLPDPLVQTPELRAAYLFDLATGDQLAKLQPTDAQAGRDFGLALDLRGDTAVVGAPGSRIVSSSADSRASIRT